MKHDKSTLGVLFYLKKDRIRSDGSIPVYARITVDKKFTQFNTKSECKEASWESGKAIGKSAEVLRLNATLNEIRAAIHTHYHTIQQRDGYVTAERVKNTFLGKEEQQKTIISRCEFVPAYPLPMHFLYHFSRRDGIFAMQILQLFVRRPNILSHLSCGNVFLCMTNTANYVPESTGI